MSWIEHQSRLPRRKIVHAGVVLLCIVFLLLGFRPSEHNPKGGFDYRSSSASSSKYHDQGSSILHKQGPFQQNVLQGFDRRLASAQDWSSNVACLASEVSGSVGVQQAIDLSLNLYQVAESVADHPLVQYPLDAFIKKNTAASLQTLVHKSWDTFGSSCIYLPSHQVHLCVSRTLFHPAKPKDRTIISFMRGQIFDIAWNHIEGYKMHWPGAESIIFPTTFDVGAGWRNKGLAYGPEDPRLVLEDVPGAEPIIVFNMMSEQINWRRGMFIHRPFTKTTTLLTIQGVERAIREKNWSAFFVKEATHGQSDYIHFLWRYAPLAILKCALSTGLCDVIYDQSVSPKLIDSYDFNNASIRGGSQFVPVPGISPGQHNIQAFLSIPRHHVEIRNVHSKPSYRPEIAVLITNTTHFVLGYISGPQELAGSKTVPAQAMSDAFGESRILISNSITSWDVDVTVPVIGKDKIERNITTDVLSFTVSFDDAKDYVVRMNGILDHLRHVPSMSPYFDDSSSFEAEYDPFSSAATFNVASDTGWHIRECAEQAAHDYTLAHAKEIAKTVP